MKPMNMIYIFYFLNGVFLLIVYFLPLNSLFFSIQDGIFLQEYPDKLLVIDTTLRMFPF